MIALDVPQIDNEKLEMAAEDIGGKFYNFPDLKTFCVQIPGLECSVFTRHFADREDTRYGIYCLLLGIKQQQISIN